MGGIRYKEKIGCIEIGNNVFIGSNTIVLCDVKIGSNVIIGAGSLVNKDIPDNSIAVGTPAKVIGTFDNFIAKRKRIRMYPDELTPICHAITNEFKNYMWDDFRRRHNK